MKRVRSDVRMVEPIEKRDDEVERKESPLSPTQKLVASIRKRRVVQVYKPAVIMALIALVVAIAPTKLQIRSSMLRVSAGFLSGLFVTTLFHPYDRALFLSVRLKRPFLTKSHWRQPFDGLLATLASRSLSAGLYLPLEDGARVLVASLSPDDGRLATVLAGNMAGILNALCLAPVAAVKYRTWGETTIENKDMSCPPSRSKIHGLNYAASRMYQRGGWAAFFTGFSATLLRDMVFGTAFAFLRREFNLPHSLGDAIAAGAAAIACSPLEYARNCQFAAAAKDDPIPSIPASLFYFASEINQRKSIIDKWRYFTTRLFLGWGTLRVAASMGLTALCYEALRSFSIYESSS